MAYVASRPEYFVGVSWGDGQCVALVEHAAHAPRDRHWHRGQRVKGDLRLTPGTAIAMFGHDGRYENDTRGNSHAAIYLGQDANGIQVIDQ